VTTGLTLGTFAPLHRGHRLVLETALAECDEVTCLVYDSPEVTDIPLEVRARWVRTLYPRVRVVEARGGPSEVGESPAIQAAHERYIRDVLGIRSVDRFYSSETYGDHMSRALGAVDRRVDPDRRVVPVSGSAIRRAPFESRRFLEPVVYRDHVITAVFLGAPGTGKTTTARLVAEHLDTVWMPEYGREYWEAHQTDRRLTPEQLLAIARGHQEREDVRIMDARAFFLVDTNALTTAVFARDYHGAVAADLAAIADACPPRYDLVFLCADDFACPDTWDRSGPVNRERMQRMVREDLAARGIAATVLQGPIEQRARAVEHALRAHRKWGRR
jgi:NadR type nicotinamide-nucleotide adenylyltransferase